MDKCDTCRLRYVCEEQAEFYCKEHNYINYTYDDRNIKDKFYWIYECKNRIQCPICGMSCNVASQIYRDYCGKCGARLYEKR
jgi:ribosomal protein S27AE